MSIVERIREVLSYDKDSGLLFWRVKTGARAKVGSVAGSRTASDGRIALSIDGVKVRAHRAAWMHAVGPIPSGYDVDHINGNASDNRLSNLRLATRSQNIANKKMHKNNACGFKGVTWCKQRKKWRAVVMHNRRPHYAGFFDSVEDAGAAYLEKARQIFGDFATNRT